MSDRTAALEAKIRAGELRPRFRDYPRLFRFVFSRAFVISGLILALNVVAQLLTPLVAFVWKLFVDRVAATPAGARPGAGLLVLLAGYASVALVRNLILNMTSLNGEHAFMLDFVQKLRFAETILTRMHEKISRLPAEYFESSDFYDRTARAFAYADDRMRREALAGLYAVVAGVAGSAAIFMALLAYHPLLGLIAILAPMPTLYSRLAGAKLSFRFKRDTTEDRRRLEYYEELIRRTAAKELRVWNAGPFILGKWERGVARYTKAETRVRLRTEALGLTGHVVNNLATAGSAVLAVWLLTRGELSLGSLGAVFALTQALVANAGALYDGIGGLISNRREVSQLFELLDLEEETEGQGEGVGPLESLQADTVYYRYPFAQEPVLRGVDFVLHRGERVALVGENGSGKTTFVKVLLGLLTPSRGWILYNGKVLESGRMPAYRERVVAVFQDFGQYRGLKVADNVRLGDFQSSKSVDEALAKAGFDAQPADVMLGRDLDGTELSGGEWQKLAIARAFYRDRELLILDEPTASLDPLAEEAVFRRFLEMARDRTALIVTHRIGTASLADRIVVFKSGRIVERGTHRELLALGGVYAALHAAQAEWYHR